MIQRRPVIEVGDPKRRVPHQPGHARQVIIVDVLRLVGHLVVIEVLAA